MNCKVCGIEFLGRESEFCSKRCYKKNRDYSENKKCSDCGEQISNVSTWCKKCSGTHQEKREIKVLECLVCKKKLVRKQSKYCSKNCKYSFLSKGRVLYTGNCFSCNKKIIPTNRFCSNRCKSKFNSENDVRRWLETGESPYMKYGQVPAFIRRYLKEINNNKCSKCGWGEANPINNVIYLEVEHIDGNPFNNHPSNLELLCPNCHTLTPTYKALNIGKHKKSRYKLRQDAGWDYLPKSKG